MTTTEERIQYVKNFVDPTIEILEQTRISEIKTFAKYLLPRCFVGQIVEAQGLKTTLLCLHIFDRSKRVLDPPIPLIPIFPEDDTVRASMEADLQELSYSKAIYKSDCNCIFFSTEEGMKDTSFSRGCTLIHESGHAYRAFQENRVGLGDSERTERSRQEEGDMHHLASLLWKERGGSRYQQLLEKAVFRIRKKLKPKTLSLIALQKFAPWQNELDAIFGKISDPKIRETRWGTFLTNAHFEIIAKVCKTQEMREQHKNLIMAIYSNMGIQ